MELRGMVLDLYARVSMEERQVPENQMGPLREWAAREGVIVGGEFVDEISSNAEIRPEREKILSRIRTGLSRGVAVWRQDRWARDNLESELFLREASARQWIFISLMDPVDFSNSDGRMVYRIRGVIDQGEKEKIAERVRAGLARARREGKHLGRPRKVVQVQMLKSALEQGRSYEDIARELGVSAGSVRNAARRLGVRSQAAGALENQMRARLEQEELKKKAEGFA